MGDSLGFGSLLRISVGRVGREHPKLVGGYQRRARLGYHEGIRRPNYCAKYFYCREGLPRHLPLMSCKCLPWSHSNIRGSSAVAVSCGACWP